MIRKILACSILLFLSQSSFVICGIWEPENNKVEKICKSDACLKMSKLYFENLNPAVNPCDDFYSFVCGAWHVKNKPPGHLAEWTIHNVMEKRILTDLREILEKPAGNIPDQELMRVKYFYNICMKQPSYGRKSPKEIGTQINKVGRFGKKSMWDIHEAYLKLTGESPFFHYNTYALRPKELIPLLIVRELISPYGAIFHNVWKSEEEENYKQFLYLLMKSLKLSGTDSTLNAKIKAVIKFRRQFNEMILLSQNRRELIFKHMSPHEFEKWFKGFAAGRAKQSGMPWEKIIRTILSVVPKGPKQDMRITTVHQEGYFKDLDKLLSSTPEEVLVDHMEIYFAERHTMFTTVMEDLLERTSIEPTDLVDYIRQDIARWETCLKHHNMWGPIGKILQEKWFNKNISHPMTELVSNLKHTIELQINNSTWLDHRTKAVTTEKLHNIKTWIGYPPWYDDPSNDIHSESPLNNPVQAEAFLNIEKLVVFIKSSLLRPPFFDSSLPNVYNYGAIGFVVGHELYHIIHECGKYTSGNNIIRWWPSKIRDVCKARVKCFIDAFKKETQREFQLKYHETTKMANKKSHLEDIPDVMGLNAAFQSYHTMEKKDISICRTLPYFEKYSCEQMFFISFANTMCGKIASKAAAKHHIETFKHSLHSVRVNGAVQNSHFFQTAFRCPKDKAMNPPIKCNIWK